MNSYLSSLTCLILAAGLVGCAPAAGPASSSSQAASAPVYDSSALDDGVLRFLFSANSTGGGTLLQGDQVLYRAAPSEDIRLLNSPETGLPNGWQKGCNSPEGGWCTEVYDAGGNLLWSGEDEWRAALSDDLLALEPGSRRVDAGPTGETGCILVDLDTDTEIPLPENTTGCIPTDAGQVVLTVTSDPDDPSMENSSVLIQTLEGEELLRVDSAYAFQAYGYEGKSGYICIQLYDPASNQWSTSFYNPVSQEYIPQFYSFCGPDLICFQGADGRYAVRSLTDPTPLAFYDGPCSYWDDGMALVSDTQGGYTLYLEDGSALPLLSYLSYTVDGDSAAFLLEDGSLLLCGPDGSQTLLTVDLHGAAKASLYSAEDGYVLLSLDTEDYQTLAYQIYDLSGLLYDSSVSPARSYDRLLYLTSTEDGPLYEAAYTGFGGVTLYDVVDCRGNVILSGLADLLTPGVFDLPDGIFAARRGFERGFMDASGEWVYAESVFTSLADDDGHYYW